MRGENNKNPILHLLWLIDGVGLSIIVGCTFLDGLEVYRDFFSDNTGLNVSTTSFWCSGKIAQLVGLLLLITYTATFQMFNELEYAGMIFLTLGPVLNLMSCSLYTSGSDPAFLFNKRWIISELLELIGILILDISLFEIHETLVLLSEVIGLSILGISALIDFEYPLDSLSVIPQWELRRDVIHITDGIGLALLVFVAIGHYTVKLMIKSDYYAIKKNDEKRALVTHSNHLINL